MKKVIEHVDALVTNVLPTREGTSKEGKAYKMKEIWVKESDDDRSELAVTLMTDEVNASENILVVGAQIVFDLEVTGHRVKYTDKNTGDEVEKVFDNINARNISLVAMPDTKASAKEKVKQVEQSALDNSDSNDLPF